MFQEIFAKKRFVPQKMVDFGFEKADGENRFVYCREILEGDFSLFVYIELGAREKAEFFMDTKLIEKVTGEEYVLYKTQAAGSFVGQVRLAIEEVLLQVAQNCCDEVVFKYPQTERLVEYVRQKYGDEPEFLWKSFPDYAVWRRKDSNKWYGVIGTVAKSRLGLESNERVEMFDLKIQSEKMAELLKNQGYYPGWHMNKKYWFTVILDGTVRDEELFARIDESYRLAKK